MRENEQAEASSGISRRKVVAGAAWSVPAIMVASAAPAMAATPDVTIGVGDACKHPGNPKRYHFDLEVTSSLETTTTVSIDSVFLVPNSGADVGFSILPADFSLAAGASTCIPVDSDVAPDSSNGTLLVTYTYTDENGIEQQAQVAINVDALPPCQQFDIPNYPHEGYTCSVTP